MTHLALYGWTLHKAASSVLQFLAQFLVILGHFFMFSCLSASYVVLWVLALPATHTRTFCLENRESINLKLKLHLFHLCAQCLIESFSLNTIVYFNKPVYLVLTTLKVFSNQIILWLLIIFRKCTIFLFLFNYGLIKKKQISKQFYFLRVSNLQINYFKLQS